MDKLPENIGLKTRSWAEWKKFRQKLDIYFVASEKEQQSDKIKVATMLAVGGDVLLDEYNANFGDGDAPKYVEALEALEEAFKEGESEHYLAHVFRTRAQREDESFAAYLKDLRLAVKPCNYGQQEDRMLRDQIIFGIRCNSTKRELLKITKLTLTEAIKLCTAMEVSHNQLQAIQRNTQAREDPSREEELMALSSRRQRLR